MKNIKKLLIVVMLVLTLFSAVGVNNVYAEGGKNDDAIQNTTGDQRNTTTNTTGNNDGSISFKCTDIPKELTSAVATVITVIKIGVPIILAVLGMIDMGKAVASQKEDEIKNGQKKLLSRCIAAGIVFFVVAIVQLLVKIVASNESTDQTTWSCVCQFFYTDPSKCQ